MKAVTTVHRASTVSDHWTLQRHMLVIKISSKLDDSQLRYSTSLLLRPEVCQLTTTKSALKYIIKFESLHKWGWIDCSSRKTRFHRRMNFSQMTPNFTEIPWPWNRELCWSYHTIIQQLVIAYKWSSKCGWRWPSLNKPRGFWYGLCGAVLYIYIFQFDEMFVSYFTYMC